MGIYPNLLIFCASRKVPPVRTKADTANIQVSILINGVVLESGDQLASPNIKNLC